MYYPNLKRSRGTRMVVDAFAGYNHQLRIGEGQFYETKNLSADYYPMLANRHKRGILSQSFTKLQAIIAKDALFWVDNGTLYKAGRATELTGLQTVKKTRLVSMGAYICIFPDKMYYNTMTDEFGSMEASHEYTGTVVYRMCHADGTYYDDVYKGSTEPVEPDNGMVWIDTVNGEVKEYVAWSQTWATIETVYTRVDFLTMGQLSAFGEYDGVRIRGMHFDDLNGSKILYGVGGDANTHYDYIVLVGIQEERYEETNAHIYIDRVVPDMDYVCEAQNRLWGCFYGNDGTQNLNEIYCCALGDFKNWEQYLGVSTDSWRASRGSDGKWTGCVNYLGVPTFFKENIIHPVSVSSVGAHQIGDIPARGVQDGSGDSLCVVNETLYYKSRTGVMAYQGGMPVDVADALGGEKYYDAVAGVFGQKYYISMRDAANSWQFFCYDAKRGLWMHEDELHAEGFTSWGDELYAKVGNQIIAINGTQGTPEGTVRWMAETGIIAYEQSVKGYGAVPIRYVSRFDLRLNMSADANMQMFIEYDSSGLWRFAGNIKLEETGSVVVPIKPRRCDHFRLRLEGWGDVRIFSIAKILGQGSDV